MHCRICGKNNIPNGYVTCGNSWCQEADHFYNMARNSRKNSKKQQEYYDRAAKAETQAIKWRQSA